MSLTAEQMQACFKRASAADRERFLPHLNEAMRMFRITSFLDRCMFLATIAHESAELTRLSENLNYSAEALCKLWPARFRTLEQAKPYHRTPQAIANKVYAERMGNGDEKSGDGWRYRGAGAIQLTGKANQMDCARYFKRDVTTMGDWLRTPEGACMSAAWFWVTRNCQSYALHDDFDAVCDLVNIGRRTTAQGDAFGFMDRLMHLRNMKSALKDTK